MSARERLTRLIDLASGGSPDERCALARELSDILLDWPQDYPAHMRNAFALLLEKIAGQLDGPARRELAARLAMDPAAPLPLLNELFFDCCPATRQAIMARHAQADEPVSSQFPPVDEALLLRAVREYPPETFVQTFARLLGIPAAIAKRACADANGEGIAMLCKGSRLSRATYSTIAMLTDVSIESAERRLDLYETVAEASATRMVRIWRERRRTGTIVPTRVEAA